MNASSAIVLQSIVHKKRIWGGDGQRENERERARERKQVCARENIKTAIEEG